MSNSGFHLLDGGRVGPIATKAVRTWLWFRDFTMGLIFGPHCGRSKPGPGCVNFLLHGLRNQILVCTNKLSRWHVKMYVLELNLTVR